jgi:hypothetical protein
MDRCIRSLGDLSALDIAGRVIRYSTDNGRTWHLARLRGGNDVVDTPTRGAGLLLTCHISSPLHRLLITQRDFGHGLLIEQAVTDDAMNRQWWND